MVTTNLLHLRRLATYIHTWPIYTNGYDSSNQWSTGTSGRIGKDIIPMVLLVNMDLIKGT